MCPHEQHVLSGCDAFASQYGVAEGIQMGMVVAIEKSAIARLSLALAQSAVAIISVSLTGLACRVCHSSPHVFHAVLVLIATQMCIPSIAWNSVAAISAVPCPATVS